MNFDNKKEWQVFNENQLTFVKLYRNQKCVVVKDAKGKEHKIKYYRGIDWYSELACFEWNDCIYFINHRKLGGYSIYILIGTILYNCSNFLDVFSRGDANNLESFLRYE